MRRRPFETRAVRAPQGEVIVLRVLKSQPHAHAPHAEKVRHTVSKDEVERVVILKGINAMTSS
ncbi:hypothetical protein D1F64_18380 [Breoghania sp. L-A4]|nr:hypothetical protein D1F64_18380 [Breoghania sp. L-A4]